MGWLQTNLKVVFYNFFYGRSILVVLYRAVTIPRPGGEAPPEKNFAFLTKSGHLTFKSVIKKGKILKLNLKRQSTDITHSLQCALNF